MQKLMIERCPVISGVIFRTRMFKNINQYRSCTLYIKYYDTPLRKILIKKFSNSMMIVKGCVIFKGVSRSEAIKEKYTA